MPTRILENVEDLRKKSEVEALGKFGVVLKKKVWFSKFSLNSHEFRSSSFVPNRGTIAYRVRLGSRIVAQKWRSGNLIGGVPVLVGNAIAIKRERRLQFSGNDSSKKFKSIVMLEEMIDASYYIPPELVTDIFLRLPVKTLIRCTSVCSSSATNCDEEEVEYQEEDYVNLGVGDEEVQHTQDHITPNQSLNDKQSKGNFNDGYTESERTEMSLPPFVPNFRNLANCVPVPRTRTEANRESCDFD
ncbi:hypothetical protein LXL04_017436 [Taraxacum kok-saghyz]